MKREQSLETTTATAEVFKIVGRSEWNWKILFPRYKMIGGGGYETKTIAENGVKKIAKRHLIELESIVERKPKAII